MHVIGELGSGKTTLVRGACRALGVAAPVTSPTFAIAHRYAAAGGLRVAHLDLYRLEHPAQEDPELYSPTTSAPTPSPSSSGRARVRPSCPRRA